MIKKLIEILTYPYKKYKEKKEFQKRLAELRKRDPFIYK